MSKLVFSELHFQCALAYVVCYCFFKLHLFLYFLSLSFSLFHASLSLSRAHVVSPCLILILNTVFQFSLALSLRPPVRLFRRRRRLLLLFLLFHFPQVPLPASRVTLGAQVLPFLFFRVVPNRTGRLRFTTATLLPTQRDQLLIVTIHAQMRAFHGLTLQPTPARSIGGTRHAHLYGQHRPFAIVTSMAQIHSFFDVRAIPPRGGFLRSARGARFHS